MTSYATKVLYFWVLFFIVAFAVMLLIKLIHSYKLRRWIKMLSNYGDILPVDVDELSAKSTNISTIIDGMNPEKEYDLNEMLRKAEKQGFEIPIIIITLLADQYKEYMSPLAMRLIQTVSDAIKGSVERNDLSQWCLELPEIEYLNNCAELYAQFLLYLPEDMEKKTMNPMHRWELREEAKQQKETRSIEARLRRNHSGY